MAEKAEEKDLLKQIAFYSELINNHKKKDYMSLLVNNRQVILPPPAPNLAWPSNSAQASASVTNRGWSSGASLSQNFYHSGNKRYVKAGLGQYSLNRTSVLLKKKEKINPLSQQDSLKNDSWSMCSAGVRTFSENAPVASITTFNTTRNDVESEVLNSSPKVSGQLNKLRCVSVKDGGLTIHINNKSKSATNFIRNNSTVLPSIKTHLPSIQQHETRIVKVPNAKNANPQVLRSTQYKWNAKEKASTISKSVTCSTPIRTREVKLRGKFRKTPATNRIVIPHAQFNYTKKLPAQRSPKFLNSKPVKSVKSKYKFVRRQSSIDYTKKLKTKYKVINCKSPKTPPFNFVRKVRKYSIKYVKKVKPTYSPVRVTNQPPKYKSPFSFNPRQTKKNFMKYHLIRRISKDFRTYSSSPFSKLIMIGGIAYKSSKTQLSRTDKKISNTVKISKLSAKKPNLITVRGVKFYMDPSGKTLKRIDETVSKPQFENGKHVIKNNMKLVRVDLGGKTYVQKEPGIFTQSKSPHARAIASRVVNRSINHLAAARRKSTQYCMFFNRFGKCRKKEEGKCPYIHDSDKVAVCTRFLQGKCDVENCLFSHKICQAKMPTCSFFLRGKCNNDACPYSHVNVNPNAEVCRDFLKGYCSLGRNCKKHHRFFCTEFQQKGMCEKGDKCPLKHVKRKSGKRELLATKVIDNSEAVNEITLTRSDEIADDEEDDVLSPKRKRLPSFIQLSDDSDGNLSKVESPVLQPLRIKPLFLNKNS